MPLYVDLSHVSLWQTRYILKSTSLYILKLIFFFFSFVCLQPICGNSYFLILGAVVNMVAPLQYCGKLGVHSTPGRSLPSGNMPKLMAEVRGVTLLSGKKCCN